VVEVTEGSVGGTAEGAGWGYATATPSLDLRATSDGNVAALVGDIAERSSMEGEEQRSRLASLPQLPMPLLGVRRNAIECLLPYSCPSTACTGAMMAEEGIAICRTPAALRPCCP